MKKQINQFCRAVLLLAALLLSHTNGICSQSNSYLFPRQSLPDRMNSIAETFHEKIVINRSETNHIVTPELDATGKTAQQAVETSLEGTDYTYAVNHNLITIYKSAGTAPSTQTGGSGTLRGKILDETGDVLPGATVKVVGGTQGTATNADGDFSLKLPAGTYTLEVGFMGYQTQRVTDVKVVSGKTTPLDVTLGQASTELSEVVVTATYNQASAEGLYARQKNIAAMSDGVSADLIKKTSDNNVAQILKRVSGVTIDQGKYVTVRGMSERYNNVQLNGASLPSTEPNRRNFSFDVIPTGLVDNVTIAKTFTPNLPGEFTGGLVEVNTLSVPDKRFLNLSVGTGWNNNSTGKRFLTNKRFKKDYWTGDIKGRQWYAGPSTKLGMQSLKNAGMMNHYPLGATTGKPTQTYSITGGYPINLGRAGDLGIVAALTYRHEENREDILEGKLITRDYNYKAGTIFKFSTSVGAVANIGWQRAGHRITWRNLLNSRFSHTNQIRYIYKYYDGTIKENYEQYSTPLQSNLKQTQLDGEHKLLDNKLIVTWNGSLNYISRTNPDDRYLLGTVFGQKADGTEAIVWAMPENRYRIKEGHSMYNRLNENKKNLALNLEHPFVVGGNRQSIKTGYLGTFRESDYQQQYITPERIDKTNAEQFMGMNPSDYYDPIHFENGIYRYLLSGMIGSGADYYKGRQDIHAAYLMGEFSFWKKLRLVTGVRAEKTNMKTVTRSADPAKIVDSDEILEIRDSTVVLKNTDWLPAATVIYSIRPELNLRGAYSKTLARPDFRELSESKYYNINDRVTVMNIKPVEISYIHNWDIRAEWYPRPGEVVSVGFFYKKFIKPVEMVVRADQSDQNYEMFSINLDQSTARGMELNWRKSLGFFCPCESLFWENMYFTGNYTWMKANVDYNYEIMYWDYYDEEQKKKALDNPDSHRSRPLQGLSPYTINLGLAYEGDFWGAAINYNKSGRKLLLGGQYTYDDQYENPRDVLDLQLSGRFMQRRLEVKLNASDVLNQDIIRYRNRGEGNKREEIDATDKGMNYNEGDWVISRIRKGVSFSMSASWKF